MLLETWESLTCIGIMGESCPQLLRLDTELKIYYLSLISGSWPFIRMDTSRKEMVTSSSANMTPAQTAIIRNNKDSFTFVHKL